LNNLKITIFRYLTILSPVYC